MSKSKKSTTEPSIPEVDKTLASEVSSLISDVEEPISKSDSSTEVQETPKEQIVEAVTEEIKVEDAKLEKTSNDSIKVVENTKPNPPTAKTAKGFLHGGSIYRGMI